MTMTDPLATPHEAATAPDAGAGTSGLRKVARALLPPIVSDALGALRGRLRAARQSAPPVPYDPASNPLQGSDLAGRYLYYGNLYPGEPQYLIDKFVGLALYPASAKDIAHNAYDPLPCKDNSIPKIQSQDVFEHLAYDKLPGVLDEIYRVLTPGGVFRLSMPDYRSPLMVRRSVYDEHGAVIADLMCGGAVVYDDAGEQRRVVFTQDGNAHVWFPLYESVRKLIAASALRHCGSVTFHHYFENAERYVCNPFADNGMFVSRAPPHDMRAGGKPVSIIVDFVK